MVSDKRLQVKFYRSANGREPVRDWLLSLSEADRRIVGTDLKTVEYGWPLGMPLCRKLRDEIWEVRSNLSGKNNIARTLFCVKNNELVLLHGFIKKTQRTPKEDIDLAFDRLRELH